MNNEQGIMNVEVYGNNVFLHFNIQHSMFNIRYFMMA